MPLRIVYVIAVFCGLSLTAAPGRQVASPAGTITNQSSFSKASGPNLLLTKGVGAIPMMGTVEPVVKLEYGTWDAVTKTYTKVAGSDKQLTVTLKADNTFTWDLGNYGPVAGKQTYRVVATLWAKAAGNPPGPEKKVATSEADIPVP